MNFTINGIQVSFDDIDVGAAGVLSDFYKLALWARKNYLERYDNLRDISNVAKDFPKAFQLVVNKVAEYIVEKLQEAEVWDVSTETFTERFLEECDAFTSEAENIYEKYQSIIGQRNLADAQRTYRKNARGKLVGGGFGLGGAMKGILVAGTVNAATGALHSMFGMFDKAASDSKFQKAFNELYRSNKTKYGLADALYEDVVTAFNVFVEYINENAVEPENLRYNFNNIKQMENIRENLKNNVIPEKAIPKALVDMLVAFPACEDTYKIIYQKCGDSDGDLVELAEFFEIDLNLREVAEGDELLADYFGDDAEAICNYLQYNPYFRAFKYEIDEPIEDLIYDCIEYANEHGVNKTFMRGVYEFSDYDNSSISAKLSSIFPASEGEIPLLFFDTSMFSSLSEGVLLTNRAIHSSKGGGKVFPIEEVRKIIAGFSEIKINDMPVSAAYNTDEQERLLTFLVIVMQFRDMESEYEDDEDSVDGGTDRKSNESLDKDVELKFFIDVKKDSGFGKYFFSYGCFQKINKSAMGNAQTIYAPFSDSETLLAFYDNTVLSNGKEGFVLTSKKIYFNNKYGKGQIAIQDIDEMQYKMIKLLPNIVINREHTIPCRFLDHKTVETLCMLFPKMKEYLKAYE